MEENIPIFISSILHANRVQKSPTFLSIIERSWDEDIISRYLLFILKTHPETIQEMMNKYDKEENASAKSHKGILEVVEATCEKLTYAQKRVDLFFKVKEENGNESIILIENKTDTDEHGDQTKSYERWAFSQSGVKEDSIFCFFLYPNYHDRKPPSSDKFLPITYGDLLEMIHGEDNFAKDFKLHIKEYLMEDIKMDERDEVTIKNYASLSEALERVDKIKDRFMEKLQEDVTAELKPRAKNELHAVFEGKSYRFYETNWWHDDAKQQYYFYIEFMMVDGDPNKLVVQRTIKKYKEKGGDLIDKFTVDTQTTLGFIKVGGPYFIKDFDSNAFFQSPTQASPLSDQWQKEADQYVIKTLKSYLEDQEKTFQVFEEWLKKNSPVA